jgi:hypothetical protein
MSSLDVLEVVSAELYWSMDGGFIQQVIPMSRISTSICGEIPTLNFLLIKGKKNTQILIVGERISLVITYE